MPSSSVSAITSHKLLDLPDELLVKILSTLLSPSSHFARSIQPARNALSLAICNTRLFKLLPKALRAISFIHHNTPYPQTALYQATRHDHLAQLVRLAGASLQALHLPLDATDDCLFPAAAKYCPNLRELWYNGARADSDFEELLFHAESNVRKLRVSDPRNLFPILIKAPLLHEFCIIDLRAERNKELIEFLTHNGNKLTALSIVYCQPERTVESQEIVQAASDLCQYLNDNMEKDMPALQTLKVGLKPWIAEMIEKVELEMMVKELSQLLTEPRQNARKSCKTLLKMLTVVGSATRTKWCLNMLRGLVSVETDVEVYFLEAGLLFPGNAADDEEMFIKSFSLARDTKQYLLQFPEQFSKLEVLSVTNDGLMKDFLSNDSDRAAILAMVRRAGPCLKHIHPTFHPAAEGTMGDVATFLDAVLREAVSLNFVLLPSRMIQLALTNKKLLVDIVSQLDSVNMLMLVPHFSVRPSSSSDEDLFETFLQSLMVFLTIVKERCPRLECLLFENVLGSFAFLNSQAVSEKTAVALEDALCAVDVLHDARPGLDAQSVATRLKSWLSSRGEDGNSCSTPADG